MGQSGQPDDGQRRGVRFCGTGGGASTCPGGLWFCCAVPLALQKGCADYLVELLQKPPNLLRNEGWGTRFCLLQRK
jgi:hypothetical protein